jgi:TolA-binding protein
MTDARKTPDDEMLQHFREHSTGEPPSHLDAFILAAAQREVPAPKPNLWQRWVQACQKPRWQVAFASLVGIALMLALVQRTPEQAPSYDFAPKASAPVAKKEAVQAPSSVARSLAAPAAPMADFAAPAQSESISVEMADEAKVSKRLAAPVKTLDEQLREVVRLQNAGQAREADELLATLHKRFPKENLAARLKEMKKN